MAFSLTVSGEAAQSNVPELEAILESIKEGKSYDGKQGGKLEIGADVLPSIPKDSTDRNRTSPFAFTGNRFEFRSVGSSLSFSGPNTILNSIRVQKRGKL